MKVKIPYLMQITFYLQLLLLLLPLTSTSQNMKSQTVSISIGELSVYVKEVKGTTPIIFLHGVYFDHNLWNYQTSRISDRTVITLDMPLHGNSKQISKRAWTLDDCGQMLIEVLDELAIEKVIAIGHSWGSMTILRAAAKAPERFLAVGFCNMPFEAATSQTRRQFRMQHILLPFRGFYTKQVAKAMYGKQTLAENQALEEHIALSMSQLSNRDLKQTDKSVIMQAEDASTLIEALEMPAFGLKGKEDYVPLSPHLETEIVAGGHISPLEVPEDVYSFVWKVASTQ